jgi:hypothetical protein
MYTVEYQSAIKKNEIARHRWLMPINLVLRRQRSGGSQFKASLGK